MTNNVLRRPAVEKMVGLSRSTIYSMMTDGDFPKPIQIGRRAVGWTETSIRDWIEARKSNSETE